MIKYLLNKFKQIGQKRHHDKIVQDYINFATSFGDGLSYSHIGSPVVKTPCGKWLHELECWDHLDALEVSYAELGYRIVSIDDWVSRGGYGQNIDHLLLVKREKDEKPIFTRDLMRNDRGSTNPN